MEEQAPYGRKNGLAGKTASSFYKGLAKIRSIGTMTQQNLILDEDRKAVATDPQNQALLETALEQMIRVTDVYFQ